MSQTAEDKRARQVDISGGKPGRTSDGETPRYSGEGSASALEKLKLQRANWAQGTKEVSSLPEMPDLKDQGVEERRVPPAVSNTLSKFGQT